MHIEAETLDDLLRETYTRLLALPFANQASRSCKEGPFSEILGVILTLKKPRARLSHTDIKGKSFSALGELLWYLSGSDKLSFIQYYIRNYKDESYDGKTIYGAYGPRLFKMKRKYNQLENVISLLKKNINSRRAVVQLFDASDIDPNNKANLISIPCTSTLQFICRENKLDMIVSMRSNDVFKGLPHDIYAFTMLQEIIASELGVELGVYKHCVGSLHLYESSKNDADDYLKEGFQTTQLNMPPMPIGSQLDNINKLLKVEKKIRKGDFYSVGDRIKDEYWQDIAYFLEFFSFFKKHDINEMKKTKQKIKAPVYIADLDKKIRYLELKSQAE
jgi:thymidylate synthase